MNIPIPLGEIILQSLPCIAYQVGEGYNKYEIETQLRWRPNRPDHHHPDDQMDEILSHWTIDETKILLIECLHHDQLTRAFSFASLSRLEEHILGLSSFLNPYVTYVIPVINGRVRNFQVHRRNGQRFAKDLWQSDDISEDFKLIWQE